MSLEVTLFYWAGWFVITGLLFFVGLILWILCWDKYQNFLHAREKLREAINLWIDKENEKRLKDV